MMMWGGYSYLEDWWLETGRTTRRADDIIFSKCGLYWPVETRQNTHGDMHWCIDKLLGKKTEDVTPEDVKQVILQEFHDSCVRMHVDYIHGYMLHWPLRTEKQELRLDWMLEGVIPAFAELYKNDKVGAIGFGNVDDSMLQQLNETAIAEGKKLNLDDFKVHFIQNQCSVLNASPKGKKSSSTSLVSGDLKTYCIDNNIVRVAYSALGHGAPISPSGEFVFVDHWGVSEEKQRKVFDFKAKSHNDFKKFADKIECSAPVLAMAWLIARDIVPLFSSMSPAHIVENTKALEYTEKVKALDEEICEWVAEYNIKLNSITNGEME